MQADFQDPRHFAVMALQLAGFPIADISDDFLHPAGGEGFDVTFSLSSDCTLTLGWDEEVRHWLLMGRLELQSDASNVATMALAVNAALPAGFRLQAELDSTSLDITADIDDEALELDGLAMVILDLVDWLHRLQQSEASTRGGLASTANAVASAELGSDELQRLHGWAIRG